MKILVPSQDLILSLKKFFFICFYMFICFFICFICCLVLSKIAQNWIDFENILNIQSFLTNILQANNNVNKALKINQTK